ncbi:hypothetical protein N7513_006596 [Penicillium frequentans]|nr:hypothetical protein N7513_006596 [Penicillium glabrum]
MQFISAIVFLATFGAVAAVPTGETGSQCSSSQSLECCSGLTKGILNINVLPALCVPLLDACNNQAACCESNGVGLLNCLTVQV